MLTFERLCAFAERDALPSAMALYGVYAGSELLYIGMSQNIKRRFSHHNKVQQFNQYNANLIKFTIFEELENLANIEVELIVKFKPVLNTSFSTYVILGKETIKGTKPILCENGSNLLTAAFNLLWEYIECSTSGLQAFKQIEKDTGLSVAWLRTFSSQKTKEPGINKVEDLYIYLGGKVEVS